MIRMEFFTKFCPMLMAVALLITLRKAAAVAELVKLNALQLCEGKLNKNTRSSACQPDLMFLLYSRKCANVIHISVLGNVSFLQTHFKPPTKWWHYWGISSVRGQLLIILCYQVSYFLKC